MSHAERFGETPAAARNTASRSGADPAPQPPIEPAPPPHNVLERPPTVAERLCRRMVRRWCAPAGHAPLELIESGRAARSRPDLPAIHVHSPRFFRRVVLGGSLGAAESYLQGEWSADSLIDVMRAIARDMGAAAELDRGGARLLRQLRSGLNWLRRNTRHGSRHNIAAHYDLSNDFFALMLDPTMTYSSGIFEHPSATMEEASLAKYDRVCRKLALQPGDHVLDIGAGWGGFAVHAASNYGCRVTATTISRQQYQYAVERVRRAGLSGRIQLLQQDYRDLAGSYDKLVSIEMIEAVGQRFLDTYFRQCSRLLCPAGMMLLQAITIPDHRYDAYRRSVDFIQRYIFPGGFLPSFSAIGQSLRRATDLRLLHCEEFGTHYARTLRNWRESFWRNVDAVRALGLDDRFIRMWHYYLCYCEAGFHERQIGVAQLLLAKPACRRDPILLQYRGN